MRLGSGGSRLIQLVFIVHWRSINLVEKKEDEKNKKNKFL